jgi:hypothetical protein
MNTLSRMEVYGRMRAVLRGKDSIRLEDLRLINNHPRLSLQDRLQLTTLLAQAKASHKVTLSLKQDLKAFEVSPMTEREVWQAIDRISEGASISRMSLLSIANDMAVPPPLANRLRGFVTARENAQRETFQLADCKRAFTQV